MISTGKFRTIIAAAAIGAIAVMDAASSTWAQSSQAPRLIVQAVNPANLTTLAGNTRPEANSANDRGMVPDSFQLNHMLLQLQRSAVQEQAFETLIDQLHDRNSPNFHKWLAASEIGTRFGLATSDIQAITGWLAQNGFTVNHVYTNGMVIDFSGTAGQVRTAFHTQIHNLSVNGVAHVANMNDPQIPTALAPAVVGIVSLHDFRAQPQMDVPSGVIPGTTTTQYIVAPADLATIYNFNPVFNSGNHGQNQTIYLIETSDVPVPNDWYTFRWVFGLPSYPTTSLKTINPPLQPNTPSNNCSDPGSPGTTITPQEATLDTEWASAAAPGAAIVLVACANITTTSTPTGGSMAPTDGLLIAVLNLINGPYAVNIISMSYGVSETFLGACSNAAFSAAFQQAVGMGFSVFVSAGDAGGAESDRSAPDGSQSTGASHGLNVNGHASTWYNVAVGGTDFEDTYLGINSTYWNSFNSTGLRSAKSYIPEIPWNNSCGSELFAQYQHPPMTPLAFCNSSGGASYLAPKGGSGGASACAFGKASTDGVVSPNCTGYARPPWQTGVVGLPSNNAYGAGVRVLPDVALFASNGPWKHAYVFCYSGPVPSGSPKNCDGSVAGFRYNGGTSFAAPIMAGIQALVNQHAGGPQGNPNYRYYQLAAQEYGASGSSACNSSNGNAVGISCVFYDITNGDNVVPCYYWTPPSLPASQTPPPTNPVNCYGLPTPPPSPLPSLYGVLSITNTPDTPAFQRDDGLGLRHWDRQRQRVQSRQELVKRSFKAGVHDFNGDSESDAA